MGAWRRRVYRVLVSTALGMGGCDFHFDQFHATEATLAQDASTEGAAPDPTSEPGQNDRRDAAPPERDGGPGREDTSARAPNGDAGAAAPVADALPTDDPCARASSTACACDASACVTPLDAGAQVPPTMPLPPDSASAGQTMPVSPIALPLAGLLLRYDFAGEGTTVQDRIGTAHGTLIGGARLAGDGALTLDGRDDYVDVPALAVSNLDDISLVAWVMSPAASCWQRVFDLGNTLGVPGEITSAALLVGELFLTPDQCPEQRVAAIARSAAAHQTAQSTQSLARNRAVQLAVVYDNTSQLLTLYIDGVRANATGTAVPVRLLSGGVFWLGRSLWAQDPFARLRYDELRVYDRALSADQVAELARRGPDLL